MKTGFMANILGDNIGEKLLSDEDNKRISEEIRGYCSSEGELFVTIQSWWAGSQRWARNQASLTGDQRDIRISIRRAIHQRNITCITNQFDKESLKAVCGFVESELDDIKKGSGSYDMMSAPLQWEPHGSVLWNDRTINRTYTENGRLVHSLTKDSREKGLLAAGYMETAAARVFRYHRDDWNREFVTQGEVTQAQCSVTVRHPLGMGSGWAGNTSFDIGQLDLPQISQLALDRCVRSLNPVRIEPGRYQVVLESDPAAVFFRLLVSQLSRDAVETGGRGAFFLDTDRSLPRHISKLGLPIVDKRITINHDPSDPLVGTHPELGIGPVTLIKDGVLTEMYSLLSSWRREQVDHYAPIHRSSFKVEGTDTSQDRMIESVKRGLLVSRLSQPEPLDLSSMLYTGVTRDGLWLIEDGKITKAVRNFRWTESPLFVLNNLEEIGAAVPAFTPVSIRDSLRGSFADALNSVVVPSLKVNDFSFTSTIDAV